MPLHILIVGGGVGGTIVANLLAQKYAILDRGGGKTVGVNDKLRAMLGYLEKLTLHPQEIQASDVAALEAAGISKQAMLEAIYVCALFNIVDRLADALDFKIPPSFTPDAKTLLKRGYKL